MVCQLMSAFVIALFLLSCDKPFITFLLWKFAVRKYMIIGLKSLRLNFIQILDQKKLDLSRQ